MHSSKLFFLAASATVVLAVACLATGLVPRALAQTAVVTCGQSISGLLEKGEGGILSADLDCSAYTGGPALNIDRGEIDLNGFTLTGPPGAATVECPDRCTVLGPGTIRGGTPSIKAWTVVKDNEEPKPDKYRGTVEVLNVTVEDPNRESGSNFASGILAAKRLVVTDSVVRLTLTDKTNSRGIWSPKVTLVRSTLDGWEDSVLVMRPDTWKGKAKLQDTTIQNVGNNGVSALLGLKIERSHITGGDAAWGLGAYTQKVIQLIDSTVTGFGSEGVGGGFVKLLRSDVSGNCILGISGCNDVNSDKAPKLIESTCGTSNWGVCSND